MNKIGIGIRNYFQIMDEDHDPPLYLYADKLWVKDNKIFIRVAHNDKPDQNLKFKKQDKENVYSIDMEEFYSFNIYFRNMGTNEIYMERNENSLFIYEKVDLMINGGLEKLKIIFKEDPNIIEVLNSVKEPFGIIYSSGFYNEKRFKEKIINIKSMLGNNFIVMGPILNPERKKFLQENQIKVIPDQFKFINKLKSSIND